MMINKIQYMINVPASPNTTERTICVDIPLPEDLYFRNLCIILHRLDARVIYYPNKVGAERNVLELNAWNQGEDIDTLHRAAINVVATIGTLPIYLLYHEKSYTISNTDLFHTIECMNWLKSKLKDNFDLLMKYEPHECSYDDPMYPPYNVFDIHTTGFLSQDESLDHFDDAIAEMRTLATVGFSSITKLIIMHVKWREFRTNVITKILPNLPDHFIYPLQTFIGDVLKFNNFATNVVYNAGIFFVEADITKGRHVDFDAIYGFLNEKLFDRIDQIIKSQHDDLTSDDFFNYCIETYQKKFADKIPVNVYINNRSAVKDLCETIFIGKGMLKHYRETITSLMDNDILAVESGDGKDGELSMLTIYYIHSLDEGEHVIHDLLQSEEFSDEIVKLVEESRQTVRMHVYAHQTFSEALNNEGSISETLAFKMPENYETRSKYIEDLSKWICENEPYGCMLIPYEKRDEESVLEIRIYPKPQCTHVLETMIGNFSKIVENFNTLNDIKDMVSEEAAKVEFNFDDTEKQIQYAQFICKDDEYYLFVDENSSDHFKEMLDIFTMSKLADKTIKYYKVPKFIIDLIKDNIPIIKSTKNDTDVDK